MRRKRHDKKKCFFSVRNFTGQRTDEKGRRIYFYIDHQGNSLTLRWKPSEMGFIEENGAWIKKEVEIDGNSKQ